MVAGVDHDKHPDDWQKCIRKAANGRIYDESGSKCQRQRNNTSSIVLDELAKAKAKTRNLFELKILWRNMVARCTGFREDARCTWNGESRSRDESSVEATTSCMNMERGEL